MNHNKVLIINSYGGSLTIAASRLKLDILGSYEDSGFGLDVQRANFPTLAYVDKKPWPKQNLAGVMVIAHPPCSSFSVQFAGKKGVHGDSFKCHEDVMNYALGQGCASLAIESVPAFLEGAREIHDQMCKKYGYNVFRVRQNAVTFGVPQWRPRCWVIFSKMPEMRLWHVPKIRYVSDILLPKGTEPFRNSGFKIAFQRLAEAGYPEERVFSELLSGEHIGNLMTIGKKVLEIDDAGPNFELIRKRWNLGGRFVVKLPRVLNPEAFATTIMHDSSFFVMGRELYREEYCKIMGFPPAYKWPGQRQKDFRLYLSKGVCPPVAEWILQQMRENLEQWPVWPSNSEMQIIQPGEIADFQIKKKDALERRK